VGCSSGVMLLLVGAAMVEYGCGIVRLAFYPACPVADDYYSANGSSASDIGRTYCTGHMPAI